MAIKTYFQNIADAIRTKGGTSVLLTPAEMPQAIADLPSGGGIEVESPLAFDVLNYTYINGANLYAYNQNNNPFDVYELETGAQYLLCLGATKGNRFRVAFFGENIAEYDGRNYNSGATITSGVQIINTNDPTAFSVVSFKAYQGNVYKYIGVQKSNVGTTGIRTYLINMSRYFL